MKRINDFLKANNKKSEYYLKLKKEGLSENAIIILKTMLSKTIKSKFAMKFIDIVNDGFKLKDSNEAINYLPYFVELYDKKFIQEAKGRIFNYSENPGLILFQYLALTRYAHMYFSLASEIDAMNIMSQVEYDNFKSKPYNDLAVFLSDCFDMIECRLKQEYLNAELKTSLIESRLKSSKDFHNPFLELEKDFNLNIEEIYILTALLKEELTGSKKPLHFEELLKIISHNQVEKIINYEILSDNSKLLTNNLIEYVGNDNRFIIGESALRYFIHQSSDNFKNYIENMNFFDYLDTQDVDLIVSNDVLELAQSLKKRTQKSVAKRLKDWGILKDDIVRANIIFYGPPGTGKTVSASYLAKTLKREIITLDCSKILDKYVGESEKNVRAIFENYKLACKETKLSPILLLNEADQFLSTRSVASHGSELMHNQMQNIFLEQLERFDGILIATTNFLDSLDPAFSRRFEYKIKFNNPNKEEREKIWKLHLPKNAEFESNFDLKTLLDYELSGAQIKMIVKNTAIKTALGDGIFRLESFKENIKKELDNDFSKEIKMGF